MFSKTSEVSENSPQPLRFSFLLANQSILISEKCINKVLTCLSTKTNSIMRSDYNFLKCCEGKSGFSAYDSTSLFRGCLHYESNTIDLLYHHFCCHFGGVLVASFDKFSVRPIYWGISSYPERDHCFFSDPHNKNTSYGR